MFLSEKTIRTALKKKRIVVENSFEGALDGMTINVRLGASILVPKLSGPLDPLGETDQIEWVKHNLPDATTKNESKGFLLPQNTLILAHTHERISLDNQTVAMINSRSTAARFGLVVHQAAPLIHPGHGMNGDKPKPRSITLELSTTLKHGMHLYAGLIVAQIKFAKTTTALAKGYDSRLKSNYAMDHGVMSPNLESLIPDPEAKQCDLNQFYQ